MNRISLITARHQFASFGVAAAVTLAVLASLGSVADGYSAAAQRAASATVADHITAVQTVVVIGKRAV